MLSNFATQYLPPMLFALIVALGLFVALALLAPRAGWVGRLWAALWEHKGAVAFLLGAILFVVAFGTFVVRSQGERHVRESAERDLLTATNLLPPDFSDTGPVTSTVAAWTASKGVGRVTEAAGWLAIGASGAVTSPVVPVREGENYRFSLAASSGEREAQVQARFLWLDRSLSVLKDAWLDVPAWALRGALSPDHPDAFHTAQAVAPTGAAAVRMVLANPGESVALVARPQLSQDGAYIEMHPNGALGSLAFSFDWETAMGGAIHSKGMEEHDPASAAQHGMAMRQGADWLNALFKANGIHATFYATGYNLLDGNTERRTFNGDPTYKWARPPEWKSDYWLTHPWFSDDPFGTVATNPQWYFGDQTRSLLTAGHEIAPHTFAHLYVRGAKPAELATDLDTWLSVAGKAGVPKPETFAFPWRSSNSLTKEFYDALAARGIRAVTRVYERDMRDLYTVGNVVVYTDVRQPQLYAGMFVMPDFLLGVASGMVGEEAAGAPVGLDTGLQVIRETLARRGTTSFWNHPEQLSDDPASQPVREAWQGVVEAAAKERDRGRLYIATVAEITAYQRDVMSVTTKLEPNGDTWRLTITNNAGHAIHGLTLTLPGEAASATSGVPFTTVYRREDGSLQLGPANAPSAGGVGRQIVFPELSAGATTVDLRWGPGVEPVR